MLLIIILLFTTISSCSDTKPFVREFGQVHFGDPGERPENGEVITFYALGDWGTGGSAQQAVANALSENVANIAPTRKISPFAIGLGDNVYEHGLPRGWERRPEAVRLLNELFGDVYREVKYGNRTINFHVVPGNHDYAGKSDRSHEYGDVLHQETTAEALYPYWKYYPVDAALNSDTNDSTNYQELAGTGPAILTRPQQMLFGNTNKLAIFAIDSQVMLDLYDQNNPLVEQHWQRLEELVAKSSADWKVIIGHHPIRSHGKHGGFSSGFWWIPPLTIVPLFDKLFVKRLQDLDNPAYRRFQTDLASFMKKDHIQIYLAGHDHSLQLIDLENNHIQIISGSAGKISGTGHKADTYFSHSAFGFVRFDVTDSQFWIEFFAIEPEHGISRSTALFKIKME